MSELNIPETWASIKFGEVFEVRRGASPRPVGDPKYFGNGKVGWLRIADVTREGRVIRKTKDTLTNEGVKKSVFIKPGELVLSNSGTVGLPCFAGIPLCVHDGFLAFPNPPKEVYPEYLYWFFLNFRTEIQKHAKVGTQANLNTTIMRGINFVLPPFSEQERIVQKIESCFEKVDETERSLNKVEVLLEKYRESLLAKAFRGELIPQNPKDEPASVLLSKIREEREKEVASNKKKKVQAFAPIEEDEKPFGIPESWEWVKLGEFVDVKGGKRIPKGMSLVDERTEYPYIRVADMKNMSVNLNKIKYLTPDIYEKIKNYTISCDDLYITVAGTIGAVGKIPLELNNANLTENADKLTNFEKVLEKNYFLYLLSSCFVQQQISDKTKQVAQPKLSVENIKKLIIPVPPLEEQERIFQFLKKALDEIYSLKRKHDLKKVLMEKIKEAILAKAFEGRLVSQIKSEGTGHELLEKILVKKEAEEAIKKTKKKTVKKKVAKKKVKKKV